MYDLNQNHNFLLPPPPIAGLLPAPKIPLERRESIRRTVRPFRPQIVSKPKILRPTAFELIGITEEEKWIHASILRATFDKLGYVRMMKNELTSEAIYYLFESHGWRCYISKTLHSDKTPLSIQFKKPLTIGGRLHVSNAVPRYFAGWLAGEYRMSWSPRNMNQELAA